jgi:hypothetical protein
MVIEPLPVGRISLNCVIAAGLPGGFLPDEAWSDWMPAKKPPASGPRKLPVGDRRQFLTTMSADVIRAVKQAALDDDRNAWEIMEEAARQWLERRKTAKARKSRAG